MSKKYEYLFSLYLKDIESLIERTHFLHQYTKDVKNSGGEIEIEIRKILESLLPNRFKVTHGFICYAINNTDDPIVSPQLDCIIVDTLVVHSIIQLSNTTGQEMVPLEAVVGIIEIKRTLDKSSIQEAISHLKITSKLFNIDKRNQKNYLMGGQTIDSLETKIYSNPFLGILGVKSSVTQKAIKRPNSYYSKQLIKDCNSANIDLIGSFSGLLICTVDNKPPHNFYPHTYRDDAELPYHYCLITEDDENIKITGKLSRLIGFIITYLSSTSGKFNSMVNYYFNKNNFR